MFKFPSLLLLGLFFAQIHHSVSAGSQQQQHIVLHDPTRQALRSTAQPRTVPSAAATGALCAATGLVPPVVLDSTAAADVEAVVQPVLAQAQPKAVLLLHLAGMNPDSSSLQKLQEAWGKEGSTVQIDLQDSSSAGSLLQAASDVVAANPDVFVTVLDHSALKGCHAGHCLQQHLHNAMHHCGGKLHASGASAQKQTPKAGLHGSLELPGLSNKLDMQLPGVKLFAVELAALQGSAQQQLDMLKQQPAEQLDKAMSLYESTFVGLQALGAHFAKGSPELQAAEDALMGVLSNVVTGLKGVYGDDVLYQVTFLGDAPVSSSDANDLMEWKEVSRRVLLQRSGGKTLSADDQTKDSKRYAEKATAYGVTLLLIWFTFAGVYCMVSMPFKQDTLLYGRTKTD